MIQKMKTNDFSSYIERYNAGEMSESEKLWFQKEMENNKALRDEVALRKKTDKIIEDQDVIALRNKLSEIEHRRSYSGEKFRLPVYIRYAAVIAVFALIGSLIFFPGKTLSNDQIIDQYYKVYEAPSNSRSAQSTDNDEFSKALDYYNAHDYSNAAVSFARILTMNPKDMQAELLNGVSNFEIKKYPEAEQSFNMVINDRNNLYIDQAEWYLAMCYIKTNDTEKARMVLTHISGGDGLYKKDAGSILKKLK